MGKCALILEPTRELAAQVETAFRDFARFMDLTVGLVYGGVGYGKQREFLATGVDVLETIASVTGREVRIDRQAGQKGDMRDTLADTAQAARDLGFIPKTPLATGLKAEWEWICS